MHFVFIFTKMSSIKMHTHHITISMLVLFCEHFSDNLVDDYECVGIEVRVNGKEDEQIVILGFNF